MSTTCGPFEHEAAVSPPFGFDSLDRLDTAAAAAVLRQQGLDDAAGLSLLLDHAVDMVHRDPRRAEALTVVGECLAQAPELAGTRARACYLRAQILAERGQLATAGGLIEQAHQLWVSVGDDVAALRANLGRMQVLDDLGDHDGAMQVGQDLLAALDRLPPSGQARTAADIRATANLNLGVAYGFTGRPSLALAAYGRAELGYRELGMLRESARPIANRGVELCTLGRPREALADFARATAIFAATGDDLFAAQCRGDAASAHRQLAEFAEALRLLEQARHDLERLGAAVEADRLKLALAETYLEAGLWGEAITTAAEVAEASETSGRTHDAATAHYLTALAELSTNGAHRAPPHLERAEALFAEVGDRQYSARVRLSRCEASAALGEHDHARELLGLCVTELQAGGWIVPLVWAYLRQADLATTVDEAQRSLDRADPLVLGLDLPEVTYQFELRTARVDRRRGRLDVAEGHLRRAMSAVDAVSGALADHVLRAAFRAERFAAHSELVDLLVERAGVGDLNRAARIADATRVRTLTDLLASPRPSVSRQDGAADELESVFAELSTTYLALQNEEQPTRRGRLAERAEALERRVTMLRLRREREPELPLIPSALLEAPTQSFGQPPVIAYFVAGQDLLAFVTNRGGTTVRRLSGALPQTHLLLDHLADEWDRFTLGLGLGLGHHDMLLRTTQDTLGRLYTLLIAPLTDLLPGAIDRLCVVPHGPMGAVPFHALFDGRQYLLERWAITMAPTQAAAATAGRDEVDLGAASVVVAVADAYAPQASTEAYLIAGLLPAATVLVDSAASTDTVVAASAGARVLHVACHGVYRPSSPLFSRLRLADRWLTATEIIGLDLTGALVVLSACESGVHGRGAEPVGIGWAFLAAGAAGVLVTLWAVHDEATLTLMEQFYRLLVAGTAPDEALRQAQLHTAARYPHPFYWAPFSYVTSPLDPSRSVKP